MRSFQKAQVKAKADVNATNTLVDPDRRPMDYACAIHNYKMQNLLRRHGGTGLCKKGEHGGFVPR